MSDLFAYVKDANRASSSRRSRGGVWRPTTADLTGRSCMRGGSTVVLHLRYYFSRIWVAPDDADRVYFGGVPMLRSADGGKTWTGIDRRGVHVDEHALALSPKDSRQVALGNDGGLNLSFDGGTTWIRVENIPAGQFTTIADTPSRTTSSEDPGQRDDEGPSNYISASSTRTPGR
jgi:hypothetical protein